MARESQITSRIDAAVKAKLGAIADVFNTEMSELFLQAVEAALPGWEADARARVLKDAKRWPPPGNKEALERAAAHVVKDLIEGSLLVRPADLLTGRGKVLYEFLRNIWGDDPDKKSREAIQKACDNLPTFPRPNQILI